MTLYQVKREFHNAGSRAMTAIAVSILAAMPSLGAIGPL
jgi:hypothetical protein